MKTNRLDRIEARLKGMRTAVTDQQRAILGLQETVRNQGKVLLDLKEEMEGAMDQYKAALKEVVTTTRQALLELYPNPLDALAAEGRAQTGKKDLGN